MSIKRLLIAAMLLFVVALGMLAGLYVYGVSRGQGLRFNFKTDNCQTEVLQILAPPWVQSPVLR